MDEEHAFYSDPDHQVPQGPPVRRRRCRGCGQVFPGGRDTMAVHGQIEHISCYDPVWDQPVLHGHVAKEQ